MVKKVKKEVTSESGRQDEARMEWEMDEPDRQDELRMEEERVLNVIFFFNFNL